MTTEVLSRVAERIVLHDVSWATYEQLLANYEDAGSPRFAYDRGVLEIMILSAKHEKFNDVFKLLVNVLAEEMSINVEGLGSTTFRRQEMGKGFEPDSCFYVQNVGRVRGKEEIDLTVDPPPDLVIEIDITHPSLDKFPIYAAVGVPEIWRYDSNALTIFILVDGNYSEAAESAALPRVTSETLSRFVMESKTRERLDWLRAVRQWARAL